MLKKKISILLIKHLKYNITVIRIEASLNFIQGRRNDLLVNISIRNLITDILVRIYISHLDPPFSSVFSTGCFLLSHVSIKSRSGICLINKVLMILELRITIIIRKCDSFWRRKWNVYFFSDLIQLITVWNVIIAISYHKTMLSIQL